MRPLIIAGVSLFVAWLYRRPGLDRQLSKDATGVSERRQCIRLFGMRQPAGLVLALVLRRLADDCGMASQSSCLSCSWCCLFSPVRSGSRTSCCSPCALLVTLLVSPYLYNYDFLMLLVPFAVLSYKSSLVEKIIVLICYLVPTFALILYGRSGNISLVLVTFIMFVLLFVRAKKPVIDFT